MHFLKKLFIAFLLLLSTVEYAHAQEIKSVGLFPICDKTTGRWGYINVRGKIVIKPQFYYAWDFSEGLAAVLVSLKRSDLDCRLGYINQQGKLVIPARFMCPFSRADFALGGNPNRFSDGLAEVYMDHKGAGYIDHQGNFVISPQFNPEGENSVFHDGVATVYSGIGGERKWSYLNKSGKIIWRENAYDSSGHGLFQDPDSFSEGLNAVFENDKCGYIDTNGDWIIQPQYIRCHSFGEGLAAVEYCKKEKNYLNVCKWGYIDRLGNFTVQPRFDWAYDFSEGLAWVETGKKWSIMNRNSLLETKTSFQFTWTSPFSENLAAFQIGHSYGFINRFVKVVIWIKSPYTMVWPEQFHKGFAHVFKGEFINMIDKHGKLLLKHDLNGALGLFHEGLARVFVGSQGGYIDRTGKYVWNPQNSCH